MLAVPTMAACSDDPEPGEVLKAGGTYVLIGAEPDDNANTVGVGYDGTVQIVGACLGAGRQTIIWPHGTKILSENPLAIDVPELGRVTVGDRIVGGGTSWQADRLPDGIDALPDGCPDDQLFAFRPE